MNKVALACVAALCALVSTAGAQPSAYVPAAGPEAGQPAPPVQTTMVPVVSPQGTAIVAAPVNEDWSNVSHINGTPVKVGERSQYLYTFKKTNISGNPFGLFFGLYDISVAHALSQNVAANVALTMVDVGSGGAFQLSATVPLYFRRTYSGPYLEGGLLMRGTTSHYDCDGCVESYAGPQLLFGWQWIFDSGLNVAIAAGVMKNVTNRDEYSDGTEPNGYFRVGYAF